MQYTLRLEQEHIGISISRDTAKKQKTQKQKHIRYISLPSFEEEKTYKESCIEYLNSSYRKIL